MYKERADSLSEIKGAGQITDARLSFYMDAEQHTGEEKYLNSRSKRSPTSRIKQEKI